ncbi:kinase-like domain-containing protein [Hygrophoropsis aurantiaca]|uniref:Kinase-like domain-containing protein n=1 Tax=Hygrophoropsis aurantiaca TaxID=72124 RepID=A0ACB7ZYB6_9AGAM|nr:kinase-like domain-containing protein [Hygrophoropsis aurantiaca]
MADYLAPAIGALQLAGTFSAVPGVAGAAIILQTINNSCAQVAIHKRKSKQLVRKCTELLNVINEHSTSLAGSEIAPAVDEAEAVLAKVGSRVQRWSRYSSFKSFLKSSQIERDLDNCQMDVDTALQKFHMTSPITIVKMQQQSMDMMSSRLANLDERLKDLLITQQEVDYAAQRHVGGGSEARELMRIGQQRLIDLQRSQTPLPPTVVYGRDRVTTSPSPTLSAPTAPTPEMTVQHQIEEALLNLHRLTGILPTVKILDNQVTKLNSTPSKGGPCSEVWEGLWLGSEKVALKCLRIMQPSDPKAERVKRRFIDEISVWANLRHDNILPLFGIVTNMGPIHIVSRWQDNGNILDYWKKNQTLNPLTLACQALRGVIYLHEHKMVHGNILNYATKQNNMLVSEEGTACICDFGLTKVIEDEAGNSASATLTNANSARWHAPELVGGEDVHLSTASDVFAFAMSILELLTKNVPYSHRKRDLSVITDLLAGRLPLKPEEPEVTRWLTEDLWAVLNKCWSSDPSCRMSAADLSSNLERLAIALESQPESFATNT